MNRVHKNDENYDSANMEVVVATGGVIVSSSYTIKLMRLMRSNENQEQNTLILSAPLSSLGLKCRYKHGRSGRQEVFEQWTHLFPRHSQISLAVTVYEYSTLIA